MLPTFPAILSFCYPFSTCSTGMEEPLLRKKRSWQEPQSKHVQSKRNEECDQYVLVSVHSSYSEALRKPKYRYNHHCQAQPDGQCGLEGALKIAHIGIHASGFMFLFDFSRHGACSSFLLLLAPDTFL